MGSKKSRIDTNRLFQNMTVKTNFLNEVEKNEEVKPELLSQKKETILTENPVNHKSLREKNIQVSIYLRPDQAKELRIQNALKEKEGDKSALSRTGIDIVLQMSSQCYNTLKQQSKIQNRLPGQLIEDALKEYFEKNK